MVALRKDVKVGFVIGGVVVSVVGVYLGLTALAATPPAPDLGANLQITPFDPKAAPTSVVVNDRSTKADANRSAMATPAPANPPVGSGGPAVANPNGPVAAANPPAQGGAGDVWGSAFTGGTIEPAVTVTPEPTVRNGGARTTVKPGEIIDSLKPGNATASGAPDPTRTTASADPSGSFTSGTPTPTLTRAGDVQSHTVQVGDTFSSIASEHYGDAKYYKLLIDANTNLDPGKLKPGMIVKVPALAKKEERSDTTDVPTATNQTVATFDPAKQYVVVTGDSLSKIATKLYGDSAMWQKIFDANKQQLPDGPARLKLGMVLNLPSPPTKR